MLSRRRSAALATLVASLAAAAPAAAAPRVVSVQGFKFVDHGRSDYVLLDVRATDARKVRLTWRGQGGARPSLRNGRVGIGFPKRGKESYRVSVRACRRGRCSKARSFSGGFTAIQMSSDPQPNSPPQEALTESDPLTGLPIPPLDPLTGLPILPVVPPAATPPPTPVSIPAGP